MNKKVSKIEITKSFQKECSICGKNIKIVLHADSTYKGGYYFGMVNTEGKKIEYWECPKCYN